MAKRANKTCYIIQMKKTNRIIASTMKNIIAEYAGIHTITLTRHLDKSSIYETDSFIISKDVPLYTIQRRYNRKPTFY